MKKILIINRLAPGDILIMTGAIRDLKLAFQDEYQIDVRTPCQYIFKYNPYITHFEYDENKFLELNRRFSNTPREDTSVASRTAYIDDVLVSENLRLLEVL